jgi:two-component system sensor histidine kinase ChiS
VIKASLEIQDFSMKFVVPNIWETISVWIGIHSGDVTLGTIGTHNRMDATIVGDVVNVASRIQWITRNANGKRIIISDKTYESIKNKQNFFIKEIWYRTLRWRKSRTRLYFIDRKF